MSLELQSKFRLMSQKHKAKELQGQEMNLQSRVEKLEKHSRPGRLIVIYEQDGKYWLSKDVDYRQAVSGEEERYISSEEYERLSAENDVILVSYVKYGMDGRPVNGDQK